MTACELYELSALPLMTGGLILLGSIWMTPRLARISTVVAGILIGSALVMIAVTSRGLVSAACAGHLP